MRRTLRGALLGFAASLVAGFALYRAYLWLGHVTGVFVMCANAPEWWIDTVSYVLPPILGMSALGIGWLAFRIGTQPSTPSDDRRPQMPR